MLLNSLRSNRLIYPAGSQPGFDASHPSNDGGLCLFSGVAQGANFTNLFTGKPGVQTATSATLGGIIGPSVNFGSASSSIGTSPAVSATTVTYAAIINLPSTNVGTFQTLFCFNGGNSDGIFINNASSLLMLRIGGVNTPTVSLTASGNTPYLYIGSVKSGVAANYFLLNLATGQRSFESVSTASTFTSFVGGCVVGNFSSPTLGAQGNIAAVAATTAYLDRSRMNQMADQPFSFWYPQQRQFYVGAIIAGIVPQRNLMGVGV